MIDVVHLEIYTAMFRLHTQVETISATLQPIKTRLIEIYTSVSSIEDFVKVLGSNLFLYFYLSLFFYNEQYFMFYKIELIMNEVFFVFSKFI